MSESTELERRLAGKSDEDCARAVNVVIEEGAKSEFGDWIRLNLRNRRDYLVGLLETGRVDANELLKIVGELRALAGMGLAFFTPMAPQQQNVGEQADE